MSLSDYQLAEAEVRILRSDIRILENRIDVGRSVTADFTFRHNNTGPDARKRRGRRPGDARTVRTVWRGRKVREHPPATDPIA